MPRDTRTRRLTRSAPGSISGDAGTVQRPLASLLAHGRKATDLLPHLHQHALDATGGVCSLLFQQNPRNGILQATSGFGLDELRTDPWVPGVDEAALVASAFERTAPTLVAEANRQMPDLSARLNVPAALLLPLFREQERVGLLAVGFVTAPSALQLPGDAGEAADAFVTALELIQLREREELLRDVRALLDEFSASLTATLNLSSGLDIFCHGANRLFAADRTSVWVHDRRARHLVLQASSDTEDVVRGLRISSEDASAPATSGMRSLRAEIVSTSADETAPALVTVPLRGTRRALGAVVCEGVRVETGGELDLLDRADELGRQLSSAIENMQLLDDVMRSRRELENTFDSISHLVAVSDTRGHIVHVNQAFASRAGRPREELLDRPITEHIGPQLAAFIEQHRASAKPTGDSAITCEVVDPVLKGPFMVTVTDLLDQDREPVGSVLVARDLTPQTRLEAERAAKIVRNLLVFAGSRRLARRSVSVNVVIQKVLSLRAAACRAQDIEVVRHYDDKLPRVQSDPLLLHQVFLNMVINAEHAIAATGAPGRIEISTSVAASADRIVASVRDTGTGIPEATLSHIFEPFYTTKEVGQGTGLGLAIAYGIVQDHGGQIIAANHPEGGAVFTVELPTVP